MRRIPLSIEVRKILKLLMYTLLGMLIVSSAFFFVKMSNMAERGYSLRENQLKQRSLESENRILKQQVLDAQSLSELRKSDVVESMEEPQGKLFVEPQGPLGRR